ncbi:uncharacterized protein LOC116347419 [Contarinia nasturtii]|uniref:uncharacterized protein LOC116347419 n=1 Tax=Contarinia nasturtii TaxID=265458 RepID=UPI0012D3F350|nr:uncharacterized protein LOC116347419 [Contarinia nasturtii]
MSFFRNIWVLALIALAIVTLPINATGNDNSPPPQDLNNQFDDVNEMETQRTLEKIQELERKVKENEQQLEKTRKKIKQTEERGYYSTSESEEEPPILKGKNEAPSSSNSRGKKQKNVRKRQSSKKQK